MMRVAPAKPNSPLEVFPSLPHIAPRTVFPAIGSRQTLERGHSNSLITGRVCPVTRQGKTGHSHFETLATHKRNDAPSSLSPATCGGGFGPAVFPSQRDVSSVHTAKVSRFVLQRCKMYTAEDTERNLHPKLMALIEHEKRLCGCAAMAMKKVASKIGVNEFWVRRIIGRYGKVKIQAHQFFNVLREHVRLRRQKISRKRKNNFAIAQEQGALRT